MKSLEEAGGAAGRAQLYFKLGKLLEKELEGLRQERKHGGPGKHDIRLTRRS